MPQNHTLLAITFALLNFIFCTLVILNLLIKSFLASIGFTSPSLTVLHSSSGATSFDGEGDPPIARGLRARFSVSVARSFVMHA